ncbi:MAG: DUF2304 domain-containing protein [Candidatus Daviesbacteria bacterium]|nr:DUF2304 domain-containing protein [Candidatus Daviesbacteria bacterium]
MIIGLQVTAIIFALVMIYFAYLHYSRGELGALEILSWVIIWMVTIVIVVFPELLSVFAKTFAISRVFDLMVIGGFIVVISMVYVSYVRTKKLEKKIEEYVRTEALNTVEKNKKK